jgi:hypothetical protein
VEPEASDESYPTDADLARIFADLADYARGLTGHSADVTLGVMPHGYPYVEVVPINAGARRISLLTDQWIVLVIGDSGGRWELDYTDEGISFAKNVIAAVVQGRIVERSTLGRSRVTVTFGDGSTQSSTGYEGCLTVLLPLPGWPHWGRLTKSSPYS